MSSSKYGLATLTGDLASTAAGKGSALVGHEGGTTVKAKLDALATVDAAAGTGSLRTLSNTATSAAAGNDARLSDARTPTAHATSHGPLGSDPVLTDAEILRNAQGILAETHSRITSTLASTALVSGTAYFHGIVLRAGTTVTNITVSVSVAGAAVTLSKVGLFSKAGLQLAVSADQGTNWHSTGNKTIAMGTPYVVPATDFYYVAVIAVFTSTAPAMIRGSTGAGSILCGTAIGSGVLPFGVQLVQADMPSPATIILGTNVALGIWGAIT